MSKLKNNSAKGKISLGLTTMAIERMKDEFYGARILDEFEGEILVKEIPLELIKDMCKAYLCTFEGLRKATSLVLGYEKKSPIFIHSEEVICTCPTASPYSEDCIWLFPRHIEDTVKVRAAETKVIFKNGASINVPVSIHTLNKQILRTAHGAFYLKD